MKITLYQYFLFLISLLILLPGCGSRVINWWERTFPQAEKTNAPIKSINGDVKTLRLYDEFSTLGIFDVLWLSDSVRKAYAKTYSIKHCLSQDEYQKLEIDQLALNSNHIDFYILAYQPPQIKIKTLSTTDSWWSVYLCIGQNKYQPIEIKIVEIPAEYRAFFAKRFNRHQTYYQVTFAFEGARKLLHSERVINLNISSAEKKGILKFSF